jgi:hypothetical protein
MPKRRVTFKLPLLRMRKIKGGDGEPSDDKMTCIIHAAWCTHCQAVMEPRNDGKSVWQKAKELIGDKCVVNEYEEIANSNDIDDLKEKGVNVDGYPTIFKMENGVITYMKEAPTPEGIYKFATGKEASVPNQEGGKRKRKTVRRKKTKKSWWGW